MNELERIKTGVCPFTQKPYDCGRCEEYKKLEFMKGPGVLHLALCFEGELSDGRRGMNHLHQLVGGRATCTQDECADYFWNLYRRGADHVPVGDNCGRFCYRRGCMGHREKSEVKEIGEA